MKHVLNIYVSCSFILGSIIYLCAKANIILPQFIRFYVNDFLIIPIVLFLCRWVLKKTRQDKNFTLKLPIIIYVCLMYSFLFEVVFPKYLVRYTADIRDVALYFLGGLVFYSLQKKSST